jgi:hypothetical protein
MDKSVSDAVTIAVGLGAALSSVWGYYFVVIVGLAAAIAALTPITLTIKIVFTVAIAASFVLSVLATKDLIDRLNSMIDYIVKNSSNDFAETARAMKFEYWQMGIQLIGSILLLGWLWAGK